MFLSSTTFIGGETPKVNIKCVRNSAVYLAFLVLIGICCVALAQVPTPAQSVILHPVGRPIWLLLLAVLPIHRTPSGHYNNASCTTLATLRGDRFCTSELAPPHLSPSMPACPSILTPANPVHPYLSLQTLSTHTSACTSCPPIPQLAPPVHPYSLPQTLSTHTSAHKSFPRCASGHPDLPSSSRARQPVLGGLRHQHGSQCQ